MYVMNLLSKHSIVIDISGEESLLLDGLLIDASRHHSLQHLRLLHVQLFVLLDRISSVVLHRRLHVLRAGLEDR